MSNGIFVEWMSKRKHAENYAKQMGVYHWLLFPLKRLNISQIEGCLERYSLPPQH